MLLFNAELMPLPVTGYFLGLENVFVVVSALLCSLCFLYAGFLTPLNKQ